MTLPFADIWTGGSGTSLFKDFTRSIQRSTIPSGKNVKKIQNFGVREWRSRILNVATSNISVEHEYSDKKMQFQLSQAVDIDPEIVSGTGNEFQCSLCPMTFQTPGEMHQHASTHKGFNKFRCDICGKRCHHKIDFEGHMNKHYNYRPFSCETCGRSFLYKNTFMRHAKTCGVVVPQEATWGPLKFNIFASY